MSIIGDNIKYLHTSHGLTQSQLGEIAGVSDKAVSTWEAGIKMPRMGALQRIATHFNISTASLIEDAGPYLNLEVPSSPTPSTPSVTPAEYDIILKFRSLDARGQSTVLNTLLHECQAVSGEGALDPLSTHA